MPSEDRILIKFSCACCRLENQGLFIPSRLEHEDVSRWMEEIVAPHVGAVHGHFSPGCQAKTFTNLVIPLDKNDPNFWIGKYTPNEPPSVPLDPPEKIPKPSNN